MSDRPAYDESETRFKPAGAVVSARARAGALRLQSLAAGLPRCPRYPVHPESAFVPVGLAPSGVFTLLFSGEEKSSTL